MGNCCYAFSRIIHVGSEWNPFCKDEEESEDEDKSGDKVGEEVSGYPSTVDVADKTLLQNGTNLITTIGLSPRVGNVASFEDMVIPMEL
jgi:hypothetical protein